VTTRRTDQTRPRSAGQGLTEQRTAAAAGDASAAAAAAAPRPTAPAAAATTGQSQQPRIIMTGPSAAPRADPDRPVDPADGPAAQTASGNNPNRYGSILLHIELGTEMPTNHKQRRRPNFYFNKHKFRKPVTAAKISFTGNRTALPNFFSTGYILKPDRNSDSAETGFSTLTSPTPDTDVSTKVYNTRDPDPRQDPVPH
jgi:hypothetical protein